MTQSTEESIQQILPIFSKILSRNVLQAMLRERSIALYWRSYTPLVVLWGFVFQRLQQDHTCDNYVDYLRAGGADQLDPADRHRVPLSQRLRSEQNPGYVQGRNRLPLAVLQWALQVVWQQLQSWMGAEGSWHGLAVRFLDGSTLSLKPAGDLAATYGHSRNQHGTHYWVHVRVLASFDLLSQAVVALVEAPYAVGETSLVLPVLQADPTTGALYVGDRNFGIYRVLQALHAHRQEGLFRLQKQQWQALVQRNGLPPLQSGQSVRCVWQPSDQDTLLAGIPAPPITGRLLYMRLQQAGFRPLDLYLFTTLLDEARYPLAALVALYGRRYSAVEVDFRHLKSTMQLDTLHVQSAAMLRKELAAACLAYNLVRALMTAAAQQAGLEVTAFSFAQAKRRLCRFLFEGPPSWLHAAQSVAHFCQRLTACQLPRQPHKVRHEPRRKRYKWRRYPPLTTDRHTARQLQLQHLQQCANS